MKAFVVEVTLDVVVMAEDLMGAYLATRAHWRDIAHDQEACLDDAREVSSPSDLPDGWDLECIPYGGDGSTRLGSIIGDKSTAKSARCDSARAYDTMDHAQLQALGQQQKTIAADLTK